MQSTSRNGFSRFTKLPLALACTAGLGLAGCAGRMTDWRSALLDPPSSEAPAVADYTSDTSRTDDDHTPDAEHDLSGRVLSALVDRFPRRDPVVRDPFLNTPVFEQRQAPVQRPNANRSASIAIARTQDSPHPPESDASVDTLDRAMQQFDAEIRAASASSEQTTTPQSVHASVDGALPVWARQAAPSDSTTDRDSIGEASWSREPASEIPPAAADRSARPHVARARPSTPSAEASRQAQATLQVEALLAVARAARQRGDVRDAVRAAALAADIAERERLEFALRERPSTLLAELETQQADRGLNAATTAATASANAPPTASTETTEGGREIAARSPLAPDHAVHTAAAMEETAESFADPPDESFPPLGEWRAAAVDSLSEGRTIFLTTAGKHASGPGLGRDPDNVRSALHITGHAADGTSTPSLDEPARFDGSLAEADRRPVGRFRESAAADAAAAATLAVPPPPPLEVPVPQTAGSPGSDSRSSGVVWWWASLFIGLGAYAVVVLRRRRTA